MAKTKFDPRLSRIFQSMLDQYHELSEDKNLLSIAFAPQFAGLYKEHCSPNWLNFYKMTEPEIVQFMFRGFEEAIGMKPTIKVDSPEELLTTWDQLIEIHLGKRKLNTDAGLDVARLRLIPFTLSGRCFKVRLACYIWFQVPISALIDHAERGSAEAFLHLVKLDASFLATEFGRRFLTEMELKQDGEMREALLGALEHDAEFWKLEGKFEHYCLYWLFVLGFAERPYREALDFLEENNLNLYKSENALAHAWRRFGLPKAKKAPKNDEDMKVSS